MMNTIRVKIDTTGDGDYDIVELVNEGRVEDIIDFEESEQAQYGGTIHELKTVDGKTILSNQIIQRIGKTIKLEIEELSEDETYVTREIEVEDTEENRDIIYNEIHGITSRIIEMESIKDELFTSIQIQKIIESEE